MWYYKEKEFTSEMIGKALGFIYIIEEISTGRVYFGQKLFWTKKIRTINKKKKKVKCESDWKKYYSSSSYINDKVKNYGDEDIKRSILILTESAGMMNYYEMQLQMDFRVLESDFYINGFIGGRISNSHINFNKFTEKDLNHINTLYKTLPNKALNWKPQL